MSAVWRAARAAVRRRGLQTFVIGVVVLFSTTTLVVAVTLLNASSAPFDRAFEQQRGAHLVATYDPAVVTDDALAAAAGEPVVDAMAGPYGQVVLDAPPRDQLRVPGVVPGPMTIVGRDDPAGSVDRVDLWKGRWATGPGEIVVETQPAVDAERMFPTGTILDIPGHEPLTVVGYAYSVSGTADAWVSSAQLASWTPTATQVLYRLDEHATDAEIDTALAKVTSGLPSESLLAARSYLVVKAAVAAGPGVYVPFLLVFGVLGLLVAILIVANVVSGAVVSGFRHIGVLKALGFTPRQVVAVYLTMVLVPAVLGAVIGAVLGGLAAEPLLANAFLGLGFGGDIGVQPWLVAAAGLGMLGIVLIAALVPASRAHSLSAAEAISAGSAPSAGRGRRVQRTLSGTRLPRAVSLGIGLLFARPGRTLLTMAAVVLAVTTVTFSTGLVTTVTAYADAVERPDGYDVRALPPDRKEPAPAEAPPEDPATEAMLRAVPGVEKFTSVVHAEVSIVGHTESIGADFLRGDSESLGYTVVDGRWFDGPGELVVPSAVMAQRGLSLGDTLNLEFDGSRAPVTIVGVILSGGPGPDGLFADRSTLPDGHVVTRGDVQYYVKLATGADTDAYIAAAVAADPALQLETNSGTSAFTVAIVSISTLLTLMLGTVAALGVLNTVVLNTRERRRDLGTLKSIGMTPRQVVTMVVTSMAALGTVGGLLGIALGALAHRVIVPFAGDAAQIELPAVLLDVWRVPSLMALIVAGTVIAVIGAYFPARSASRLTIAEVLHNE